jgi:hypothetical protein
MHSNSDAPAATARGLNGRTWDGVEIIRRPADGFVSATGICKATGKRWVKYAENQRTHEYIRALLKDLDRQTDCGAAEVRIRTSGKASVNAPVTGIPATGNLGRQTDCAAAVARIRTSENRRASRASRNVIGIPVEGAAAVVQVVRGGRPELQGTWIHPRLAVDLARWVSPEFAVWMDGWFLDVMREQYSAAAQRPQTVKQPTTADGWPQVGPRFNLLPIMDNDGLEFLYDLFVEENGIEYLTNVFTSQTVVEAHRWALQLQQGGRIHPSMYGDDLKPFMDSFPIVGLQEFDHSDPPVVKPIARHLLQWLRSCAPRTPGMSHPRP